MGVDDFILKYGKDELLKSIENTLIIFTDLTMNPTHKFNTKELVLALGGVKDEEAKNFTVNLPSYERKRILEQANRIRYTFNKSKPLKAENNLLVREKLTDPLSKTFKELGKVLGRSEKVYQNSNKRSLVVPEENGIRYLFDAKEATHYLSNFIAFREVSRKADGEIKYGPYDKISLDIMGGFLQLSDNFKHLKSIDYASSFPVVADGELLSIPGYHSGARFYYHGEEVIPAKENLKYLNRFIDSFPFEGEVDKVNFLGLLVGLFDRLGFQGEFPMIAVKGDRQSLGKTMLMDCFSVIVEGKEATFLSLGDENEIEKAVVSCLMSSNVVILDNIKARTNNSTISSPFLEKASTSKELTARLLGGNNNFVRPNTYILGLTLNGGVFSNDLLTRQVVLSLHSAQEAKLIHDFDVLGFVKENRSRIISALAYLRLAKKKIVPNSIEGIGSFKFLRFAKHVNAILHANNIGGFLTNQDDLKSKSDPFLVALLDFLHSRLTNGSHFSLTPGQIASCLPEEVFSEVAGRSNYAAEVGRRLSKYVGKSIGSDPEYKVVKKTSGNNSTYYFGIKDGQVGGNSDLGNNIE